MADWRGRLLPQALQKRSQGRLQVGGELGGEDQLRQIYQLCRRDSTVLLEGGSEAEEYPGEMIRPRWTGQARFERVFKLAMAPLHHPITLRVESSGGNVKNAELVADVLPQGGGELSALVCSEPGRHTKPGDPPGDEGVGAGHRLYAA
jgi:hypothetical protein